MKKLVLEINPATVRDHTRFNDFVHVMCADALDGWIARVRLSPTQAIIAFPKFGTVGVGFQKETDWNTNLPASTPAEKLYEHIAHNKGSTKISKASCLEAIRLLQPYARAWLDCGREKTESPS